MKKKEKGGAMIREQELTYVHTRSGREGRPLKTCPAAKSFQQKKSGSRQFANKKEWGTSPCPSDFQSRYRYVNLLCPMSAPGKKNSGHFCKVRTAECTNSVHPPSLECQKRGEGILFCPGECVKK